MNNKISQYVVYVSIVFGLSNLIGFINNMLKIPTAVYLFFSGVYLLYILLFKIKDLKDIINKSTYLKLFLLLSIVMFISIIVNYRFFLIQNIISYFLFFIPVWSLIISLYFLPNDLKRNLFINILFITFIVLTIYNLLSLIMYVLDFSYSIDIVGLPRPLFIGVNAGNLYGIYLSSNNFYSLISVFITLIFANVYNLFNTKELSIKKLSVIGALFLNILFSILTNSFSTFISMSVALLLLCLLLIYFHVRKNSKFKIIYHSFICLSLLVFFVLFGIIIYNMYLYLSIHKQSDFIYEPIFGYNFALIKETHIYSHGPISGRLKLWEYGYSYFKISPFFGHGPKYLYDFQSIINESNITTFHSDFVHLIVTYGLISFVIYSIIILRTIRIIILRIIFYLENSNFTYYVFWTLILSLLIALITKSLIEVGLISFFHYTSLFYWSLITFVNMFGNLSKTKFKFKMFILK